MEFGVGTWWGELCGIIKRDPGSRKWEGEVFWFQCASDGGGYRFRVQLNWTPLCGSLVRYQNAAWSAMCVPLSASRVDLFWSVLPANIHGVNRSAQVLISKWDSTSSH